ncbi:glycosyltransferase family 2 protein [Pannus brasiliensis CCIBt3594]|uniref:Glycosyltransferase family 2 protein n=1 Tax=Pannus brasiliensis CCIBt3594 TaxID=1427578 RepID=A0AAW9R1Y1_9CHRO
MQYPSVSVCFPAYNEAAVIREVLEEAYQIMEASGLDYEILVCNDGSRDGTAEIVDELDRTIPTLKVFHNVPNQGMRYTYELLYHSGTKDFIFLNDADRQWPTECLFDLLRLTEDYDIVIAKRRNKNYGWYRQFVSDSYNRICRWVFGVKTYDAGAVKLVKREIVHRFPLVSLSPFTEAERIIRATRAGYRVTACVVETRPRETGVATGAKFGLIYEALQDVVRVWWSLNGKRN